MDTKQNAKEPSPYHRHKVVETERTTVTPRTTTVVDWCWCGAHRTITIERHVAVATPWTRS